jgi:hypothetical protein
MAGIIADNMPTSVLKTTARKIVSGKKFSDFASSDTGVVANKTFNGLKVVTKIIMPTKPPIEDIIMLSPRINDNIIKRVNPKIRNTAISLVRSREVMAIVFAAMSMITITMITPIEIINNFTFPSIDTIPIWKAFSLSVFVG